MGLRKHKKKQFLWGIVVFMLLLGPGIFFSRSPILVVTDSFFDVLYGRWRTWEKRLILSFRFFRLVKPVVIGENADQDMVAFGVEAASARPYCVLFPFRYGEGARRYAGEHPAVPVAVLGGRLPPPQGEEKLLFFGTDTALDLYRAGLCAAAFIKPEEEVFIFPDLIFPETDRKAFLEGLRVRGYLKDPFYMNAYADLSSRMGISVVMTGTPPAFLEGRVKIPIILFSWMDPAISSADVKLVFDDSPWALAPEVIKILGQNGEEQVVPSEISVLDRRIQEKALVKEIKNLIRQEPVTP
ncbi:MAG: hypothetical protein LBG08_08360 [Spirochaetaceae bacterium]|jgi:hypothetical protein|nr:hypothetical protein [Spirochaetaceae bacterium]